MKAPFVFSMQCSSKKGNLKKDVLKAATYVDFSHRKGLWKVTIINPPIHITKNAEAPGYLKKS